MINRSVIKEKGKGEIEKKYWLCVLISFICLFLCSVNSGIWKENCLSYITAYNIIETISFGFSLSMVVHIFAYEPFCVGATNFYLKNTENAAEFEDTKHGFDKNYLNIVFVQFMKDLFIGLWSLLFIIPGIVMSYAYWCVPYILAENPDIKWEDALKLSRKMTDGKKADMFVFDLSFIGWKILGCFTIGILDILYTNPYKDAASAELYKTLKEEYKKVSEQPQTEKQA